MYFTYKFSVSKGCKPWTGSALFTYIPKTGFQSKYEKELAAWNQHWWRSACASVQPGKSSLSIIRIPQVQKFNVNKMLVLIKLYRHICWFESLLLLGVLWHLLRWMGTLPPSPLCKQLESVLNQHWFNMRGIIFLKWPPWEAMHNVNESFSHKSVSFHLKFRERGEKNKREKNVLICFPLYGYQSSHIFFSFLAPY